MTSLAEDVTRGSGNHRFPEVPPKPVGKRPWVSRGLVFPSLVFTIVVTQVPFLMTIVYSLDSWNLIIPGSRHFTGLDNYKKVFSDSGFRNAAVNSIKMTVGAVLGSYLLGLGLALLVNRRFRGQGLVRTFMLTPFLVLPAAAALLWKTSMLNASFGLVNFVFRPFGAGTTDWTTVHPMLSIVTILTWQWAPFMMLILLAGLQSQPVETLEAAQVDGASAWAVFRYLTVPHLRPFSELGIFLGSVFLVQNFDSVYLTTSGGPGNASTNLPYYLYLKAFRSFDIGLAATMAVVVLVATLVIASFALRIMSSLLRTAEGTDR